MERTYSPIRQVLALLSRLPVLFLVLGLFAGTVAAAPPPQTPAEITLDETDSGAVVQLNQDQALVVRLEGLPGAGYVWEIEDEALDGAVLRQAQPMVLERLDGSTSIEEALDGAPMVSVFRFETLSAGQSELKMVYHRPWEQDNASGQDSASQEVFQVQVEGVGPFTRDKGPAFELPVSDAALAAAAEDGSVDGLPAAYNACDYGVCTPVRDQGSCGSCWSFSAVGIMESAVAATGLTRNYSEQYLLSCNLMGYDCSGGLAPRAHQYHIATYSADPAGPGARLESDFAYTASDATSCGTHTPREKLASWSYVDDSFDMPSVAQIKQAIYDYGPISVSVCAYNAFSSYTGGTFTTDEAWYCSGGTNHAVILTGWDDSKSAWIMKNSWGTYWGIDGYMYIRWGISSIGRRANYVQFEGSTPNPPTNLTATAASDVEMWVKWVDRSAVETGYKVYRSPDGSIDWTQVATLTQNSSQYLDSGLTANTVYYYRALAYNSEGDSPYSNIDDARTWAYPPEFVYLPMLMHDE